MYNLLHFSKATSNFLITSVPLETSVVSSMRGSSDLTCTQSAWQDYLHAANGSPRPRSLVVLLLLAFAAGVGPGWRCGSCGLSLSAYFLCGFSTFPWVKRNTLFSSTVSVTGPHVPFLCACSHMHGMTQSGANITGPCNGCAWRILMFATAPLLLQLQLDISSTCQKARCYGACMQARTQTSSGIFLRCDVTSF